MVETISFWYSQIDPAPVRRPPLTGSREADVCIVGAGFTGLWTAYYLLRADPSLAVVVLEANVAGFGASGRNGGWVEGRTAGTRDFWASLAGRAAAVAQERAAQRAVDEVGKVVAAEGIDCAFYKGGAMMSLAQTPLQLEQQRAAVEHDRLWGFGPDDYVLLDGQAVAERIAVQNVLGARFSPHYARVQPARLAVGLSQAVERLGATIYEDTPATAIEPGIARTASGTVRAKFVVRATEAYTRSLAGQRRMILPTASTMIATQVLPPETWDALRWKEAETFLDGTRRHVYVQRTGDGRIALGGRGRPYAYASQTGAESAPDPEAVRSLRERLIELFPQLSEVTLEGAWQGVMGASREWAPAVGLDRDSGIAWAGAYGGQGVCAANLAGQTLADLILGQDTELTHLPWVRPLTRQWPAEPFRYLGVTGVSTMMGIADQREWRMDRTSIVGRLAHLITGRNLE